MEPKTQRGRDVIVLSYDDMMSALGLPTTFESGYIICWLTDYVRHGYRAESLSGRFQAIAKEAERRRMDFPTKPSPGYTSCRDTMKALRKIDPSRTDRATVIGIVDIERCLDHWGIKTIADYTTCDPRHCALAVRALMCHAGMMRGVEHRSGLLVSDITVVSESHVELVIAERYSEKKMKTKPGRVVIMPITEHRWSSGAALVAYLNRFHGKPAVGQRLYFQFRGKGHDAIAMRHRPSTDAQFMRGLKEALRHCSELKPKELQRVTNHSLRAGGCTDMFVAGLPAELIRAIGGWDTFCFLVYVRPEREHRWKVAAQLVQAIRSAKS